jgi:acetyl-CoA carboxylase biotin carboxyl carrier protein
MTLDEIRELIELVKETGVAELEVQRGENRVRIRLALGSALGPDAQQAAAPVYHASAPPSPLTPAEAEPTPDPAVVLVKSPIVGTFYDSASPGSPPFVRVGEKVQPGKVLCIIESMKLMNEIEAETAGILESKLVPNGQPVEYGEALFAIRPL